MWPLRYSGSKALPAAVSKELASAKDANLVRVYLVSMILVPTNMLQSGYVFGRSWTVAVTRLRHRVFTADRTGLSE